MAMLYAIGRGVFRTRSVCDKIWCIVSILWRRWKVSVLFKVAIVGYCKLLVTVLN